MPRPRNLRLLCPRACRCQACAPQRTADAALSPHISGLRTPLKFLDKSDEARPGKERPEEWDVKPRGGGTRWRKYARKYPTASRNERRETIIPAHTRDSKRLITEAKYAVKGVFEKFSKTLLRFARSASLPGVADAALRKTEPSAQAGNEPVAFREFDEFIHQTSIHKAENSRAGAAGQLRYGVQNRVEQPESHSPKPSLGPAFPFRQHHGVAFAPF